MSATQLTVEKDACYKQLSIAYIFTNDQTVRYFNSAPEISQVQMTIESRQSHNVKW